MAGLEQAADELGVGRAAVRATRRTDLRWLVQGSCAASGGERRSCASPLAAGGPAENCAEPGESRWPVQGLSQGGRGYTWAALLTAGSQGFT